MKKLLFVAAMLLSANAFATAFCDGFRAGYKEGYCYQEYACVTPVTPVCPVPNVGERTFQDGYNRGFMAGQYSR